MPDYTVDIPEDIEPTNDMFAGDFFVSVEGDPLLKKIAEKCLLFGNIDNTIYFTHDGYHLMRFAAICNRLNHFKDIEYEETGIHKTHRYFAHYNKRTFHTYEELKDFYDNYYEEAEHLAHIQHWGFEEPVPEIDQNEEVWKIIEERRVWCEHRGIEYVHWTDILWILQKCRKAGCPITRAEFKAYTGI